MNSISVRRYPRASYSKSCYVPPVPPAPRAPQLLPLTSREAQIHDIDGLLDYLPASANKNLRSFIADVFDPALLAAYAAPI